MFKFETGNWNARTGQRVRYLALGLTILSLAALLGLAGLVSANGARQIAGTGYVPAAGECEDPVVNDQGLAPDLSLRLTGDLDGCLYTWVVEGFVHPGNTYNETGYEIFVAADGSGTFETTYRFTAKADDLTTFTGQQYGRCQHPIVRGSGTGAYAGVSGRLDVKDNIVNGVAVDFPYWGHLRFN